MLMHYNNYDLLMTGCCGPHLRRCGILRSGLNVDEPKQSPICGGT